MAYFPTIKKTVTANDTFIIPKGFMIADVVFENTTANAVTGGVKVGTTNGGIEVIVALAVAGNSLQAVTVSTLLMDIFSMSSDTTLYIQAVVAWNSASVNIYFVLQKLA